MATASANEDRPDVDPSPPAQAEVVVRDRGSSKARHRGVIEVEDLSEVLTRIALRTGPNGPDAPVTQYIVAQAARHLFTRLVGDVGVGDGVAPPRVLSALIGHEPFVENVLEISPHHMRRRWPIAADWYGDLISYVLRPKRYRDNEQRVAGELLYWVVLPFGEMTSRFVAHQVATLQDPELFRLPATLYALWPEYQPIRDSYAEYRNSIQEIWVPLYREMMTLYRLRLRTGVEFNDVCWMFETVVAQAAKDVTLDWDPDHAAARSARVILSFIAGAVESDDGALLTQEELASRTPAPS